MVAPKQLTMNISITFEIPSGKVSLAAIEETVRENLKEAGRLMIKAFLEALQERLSFMLEASHPERFVRNGRHGRGRLFNTIFGEIRVANRQLRDKETGKTVRLLPLAVDFRPRKRFSLGAYVPL